MNQGCYSAWETGARNPTSSKGRRNDNGSSLSNEARKHRRFLIMIEVVVPKPYKPETL